VIKLKTPLPATVRPCASARSDVPHSGKPTVLSFCASCTPPPPPPPLGVSLRKCDASNKRQQFAYSQHDSTVSQGGKCLSLSMTGLGAADEKLMPDATQRSPVVLAPCAGERGASDYAKYSVVQGDMGTRASRDAARERLRSSEGDDAAANHFTWSPELGVLRSTYSSCNLCIGICK